MTDHRVAVEVEVVCPRWAVLKRSTKSRATHSCCLPTSKSLIDQTKLWIRLRESRVYETQLWLFYEKVRNRFSEKKNKVQSFKDFLKLVPRQLSDPYPIHRSSQIGIYIWTRDPRRRMGERGSPIKVYSLILCSLVAARQLRHLFEKNQTLMRFQTI